MKITLFMLASALTLNVSAQSKELFAGESKFAGCLQDIPLTYKSKDKEAVTKKAKELEGKELVLLRYDKKTKGVSYKKYYLVNEEVTNDSNNYLVAKELFEANKNEAVFIDFDPKTDRFYTAECFGQVLEQNGDLKNSITEMK